jgi:hypothetical protein
MDLTRFKADPQLEDEGVWTSVDVGTGARIKIARIGNRRYREAMTKRLKPYRRALRNGTLDERVTEQITAEVLAETVLLDWQGLTDGGAPLTYSAEAARTLLCDTRFKDFRDLVVEMASDLELYRQQDLEDAEKNSETSSSGSWTGETSSTS